MRRAQLVPSKPAHVPKRCHPVRNEMKRRRSELCSAQGMLAITSSDSMHGGSQYFDLLELFKTGPLSRYLLAHLLSLPACTMWKSRCVIWRWAVILYRELLPLVSSCLFAASKLYHTLNFFQNARSPWACSTSNWKGTGQTAMPGIIFLQWHARRQDSAPLHYTVLFSRGNRFQSDFCPIEPFISTSYGFNVHAWSFLTGTGNIPLIPKRPYY